MPKHSFPSSYLNILNELLIRLDAKEALFSLAVGIYSTSRSAIMVRKSCIEKASRRNVCNDDMAMDHASHQIESGHNQIVDEN